MSENNFSRRHVCALSLLGAAGTDWFQRVDKLKPQAVREPKLADDARKRLRCRVGKKELC